MLEPFGLDPHPASTARRDISSSHTQHSQLMIVCGVQAITIALSSHSFKVRVLLQQYLPSQEESTQRGSGCFAPSGLRHKREKFGATI